MLKSLKEAKKHVRRHKSPRNVYNYKALLQETIEKVAEAKEKWWKEECLLFQNDSDKDMWKRVERLSNQSSQNGIQPIQVINEDGTQSFVFEDQNIIKEMEKYHVIKKPNIDMSKLEGAEKDVEEAKKVAQAGSGNQIMNGDITDREIASTFDTCKGAPGPDTISAKMIDECDRESMHSCLKVIWNKLSLFFSLRPL